MNIKGPFHLVEGEKIVLTRDGTWLSDGTEITHIPTRDAFARAIHWDEKARQYYIALGYERIIVEVEDTPYFVNALSRHGQEIRAVLSNFTEAPVRPESLEYRDRSLYLNLPGGMKARFLSAPYYDLMRDLRKDEAGYFIMLGGVRVKLGARD